MNGRKIIAHMAIALLVLVSTRMEARYRRDKDEPMTLGTIDRSKIPSMRKGKSSKKRIACPVCGSARSAQKMPPVRLVELQAPQPIAQPKPQPKPVETPRITIAPQPVVKQPAVTKEKPVVTPMSTTPKDTALTTPTPPKPTETKKTAELTTPKNPEESKLKEIKTEKEFNECAKSSPCTVIEVYAPWCGPCKSMVPRLTRLAKKYDGKIAFAKINGESVSAIRKKFNIDSYPRFYFYKNGKMVHQTRGGMEEGLMEHHLATAFPELKAQ